MLAQTDCGLAALECLFSGETVAYRKGIHCVGHRFSKALVIEGKLTLGNHLHMDGSGLCFLTFCNLNLIK